MLTYLRVCFCQFVYVCRKPYVVLLGDAVETNIQHSILPRQEVLSRLRDRNEPILLFGESEIDSFKRLRKCELLEPEVNKV